MSKKKEDLWLQDILDAIAKVEHHPSFSRGRDGYNQDEYFRDVVYLHLERICEAATHLCREFDYESKYPELPWARIIKMRIILAHHYWNIEDEIIWNIVEEHLPTLKSFVQGIVK